MRYTDVRLAQMKEAIAQGQITRAGCPTCGCEYDPKDNGGSIGQADVSRPKITSIGTLSGLVGGGTSVAIIGHALSVKPPIVRFDGELCVDVVVVDDDHMTVATPAAPYLRVNTQGPVTGTLTPGDEVTGIESGETGEIHSISDGQIRLINVSGPFTPGEWLEKDGSNKVKVEADSIYAPCDVTVANENGWRSQGGGLSGAFTFVP